MYPDNPGFGMWSLHAGLTTAPPPSPNPFSPHHGRLLAEPSVIPAPACMSSPICCNSLISHHKTLTFTRHHIISLTSRFAAPSIPAPLLLITATYSIQLRCHPPTHTTCPWPPSAPVSKGSHHIPLPPPPQHVSCYTVNAWFFLHNLSASYALEKEGLGLFYPKISRAKHDHETDA